MSDSAGSGGVAGIGFFGLLTVVLIALKLLNLVEISWWLIAGVFFAPLAIFIGVMVFILFIAGLMAVFNR